MNGLSAQSEAVLLYDKDGVYELPTGGVLPVSPELIYSDNWLHSSATIFTQNVKY